MTFNQGELIVYQFEGGRATVDVRLERRAVCAKFAHTAEAGKTYKVLHYNLDVIISVGYWVKSQQETRFRIWALAS